MAKELNVFKSFDVDDRVCYDIEKERNILMIKREQYLKRLRPFYDLDMIKVITGVRRCGKSVLLKQIKADSWKWDIKNQKSYILILKITKIENI